MNHILARSVLRVSRPRVSISTPITSRFGARLPIAPQKRTLHDHSHPPYSPESKKYMENWRLYSLLMLPVWIIICWIGWQNEHKHHHETPRPAFRKYWYLRNRQNLPRPLPWGPNTIFYNPAANPTPEGYEDELAAAALEDQQEDDDE